VITQRFFVEAPDGTVLEFTREEAVALAADLNEALGQVPGGVADDLALILSELKHVQELLVGMDTFEVEPLGGGPMISPEEALARVQAMENIPAPQAYQRNPGSGIGNG
jgi:hypothetical protein